MQSWLTTTDAKWMLFVHLALFCPVIVVLKTLLLLACDQILLIRRKLMYYAAGPKYQGVPGAVLWGPLQGETL